MRVTRADVAKKAGVSTATVSYVLNNSRSISNDTRTRVLDVIKELNYKPDLIARSMVTNETKQLSIVLNDIVNPFFGEIVLGFENAAIEKGYFVNICTGYKNLDEYFDHFLSRRIDGIFIVALPYKFHMERLYRLMDSGIKVVMSGNRETDIMKVSAVDNDYIDAMDQAVAYLVKLGHKNIAYISGLSRTLKFDRRVEGYLNAIEKYGLSCGDDLLIDGNAPYNTTIQEGYTLIKKLIASGRKFSAVICTNDLMALGAIKSLKESGLRVPEDVSVMGFDGIKFGENWEPSLTTMSVPKSFLGEKAFELLYYNIKKGNTGFYMNRLELVVRDSTGACK